MLREIVESIGKWEIVPSVGDVNKGKKILVYRNDGDLIEIAQTTKDEYAIALYFNDGNSDDVRYELEKSDLNDILSQYKDDIGKVKVPMKLLSKTDVLADEEEDWGAEE